jgi:hypothetical protein
MSPNPTVSSEEISIRRAPKFLAFSLTGFFLGAVIAFVAGLGTAEFAGLLVAFGGIFGGGIGILAALLFDVFLRGRGSKLQATKIVE